jgi:predicted Rossmann-fold nucleotide-binding protein
MIDTPEFDKISGMVDWLKKVPYKVMRFGRLYTAEELYEGYTPSDNEEEDRASFAQCYDTRVYRHFTEQGIIALKMKESVARTLHDHGIHSALVNFFAEHDPRTCVGIMGGHAIRRSDPMFERVALLSKHLTEEGFIMVSGGGPGAMEATHLGAWMAGRSDAELAEAVRTMAEAAETFNNWRWLQSALEVKRRYPQTRYISLGIPTYLYGHEPSTPLATHIAKYFTNSVREDTILTVAFGGIIYTPGSAGTLQEIFQNAVQNHYLSFGFASPMIFLGKDFWREEVPVWTFIENMVDNGRYKNLILTLTDDTGEAEQALKDFRADNDAHVFKMPTLSSPAIIPSPVE